MTLCLHACLSCIGQGPVTAWNSNHRYSSWDGSAFPSLLSWHLRYWSEGCTFQAMLETLQWWSDFLEIAPQTLLPAPGKNCEIGEGWRLGGSPGMGVIWKYGLGLKWGYAICKAYKAWDILLWAQCSKSPIWELLAYWPISKDWALIGVAQICLVSEHRSSSSPNVWFMGTPWYSTLSRENSSSIFGMGDKAGICCVQV